MVNGKRSNIEIARQQRKWRDARSAVPEGQPRDYAPRPVVDPRRVDPELHWLLKQFTPRSGYLLCILSGLATMSLGLWLLGWWS